MTASRRAKAVFGIRSDDTLQAAAKALADASADRQIILILGNGISPVDILDFPTFRSRQQSRAGKMLKHDELEDQYFRFLEMVRLKTSCYLPHENLLYIMRLVRKGIVKAIITTNYDRVLVSVFLRHGSGYTCVSNPCLSSGATTPQEWDCDGYYSSRRLPTRAIPLWKIHGDIGFVRMDACAHVLALPRFVVREYGPSDISEPSSFHTSVFRADGSDYPEPRLKLDHACRRYRHYVDFQSKRDLFRKESEAAQKQLLSHAAKGGAVFVMGMSFNPVFKEELASVLAKVATTAPLFYIVASKDRPFDLSRSELLQELMRGSLPFYLINEVNGTGVIDEALEEILTRAGESNLHDEYESWKKGGQWWLLP
jgi:hypothetical protein